jgi:hypothetical protein
MLMSRSTVLDRRNLIVAPSAAQHSPRSYNGIDGSRMDASILSTSVPSASASPFEMSDSLVSIHGCMAMVELLPAAAAAAAAAVAIFVEAGCYLLSFCARSSADAATAAPPAGDLIRKKSSGTCMGLQPLIRGLLGDSFER